MHPLALLLISALPTAGRDLAAPLQAEKLRIQRELRDTPSTDPNFKDTKGLIEASLERAGNALKAKRYYLGLDEIAKARVNLEALRCVEENQQAIQKGLTGFEEEWVKATAERKGLESKVSFPADSPAAVLALAESAQGKTMNVLQAGRAYAHATDAHFGFYYLGTTRGMAGFASFCSSLEIARRRSPLPLRSVLPELHRLQEQVVGSFKPPRSIERHSDFIRLNGTLKLAGELDAATYYAGALYQYLDAVQQFAAFDMAAPNAAEKARLRQEIVAIKARLQRSGRDDSIAELFVQRAQAKLAEKEPNAEAWKCAEAMVKQVLPSYFAVFEKSVEQAPNAPARVTVTLVRWPYT